MTRWRVLGLGSLVVMVGAVALLASGKVPDGAKMARHACEIATRDGDIQLAPSLTTSVFDAQRADLHAAEPEARHAGRTAGFWTSLASAVDAEATVFDDAASSFDATAGQEPGARAAAIAPLQATSTRYEATIRSQCAEAARSR